MTRCFIHVLLSVCAFALFFRPPQATAQPAAPDPLLVVQAGVNAAAETGVPKAKVCDTRGRRSQAHVAETWAITVSSGGGGCGHARQPSGRTSNITYAIATAPKHGTIAQ